MNKVILMGRLTRDVETRTTTNNSTIARFSIAVERRFKREGQPDADFFNCVCFGKQAEFCEKYLSKGVKIALVGSIQNEKYTNKDGVEVTATNIVVDEIEFAESKKANADNSGNNNGGFMAIPDGIMEELPFS